MNNAALLSPADIRVIRGYVQTKYKRLTSEKQAKIVAEAVKTTVQRRMPELPSDLQSQMADKLVRRCLVEERRAILPADVLDACASITLPDPQLKALVAGSILRWLQKNESGQWDENRLAARMGEPFGKVGRSARGTVPNASGRAKLAADGTSAFNESIGNDEGAAQGTPVDTQRTASNASGRARLAADGTSAFNKSIGNDEGAAHGTAAGARGNVVDTKGTAAGARGNVVDTKGTAAGARGTVVDTKGTAADARGTVVDTTGDLALAEVSVSAIGESIGSEADVVKEASAQLATGNECRSMEALAGELASVQRRFAGVAAVPKVVWALAIMLLFGGIAAAAMAERQPAPVPAVQSAAPSILPEPQVVSAPPPDIGMPVHMRYQDIDKEAIQTYLISRDSMLADEPYFSAIVDSGREHDVHPLLLFAIAGQEQGFVPKTSKHAERIANNPFNVFHSWERFNTNIHESADIAARTVSRQGAKRPEGFDPFDWLNETYAEDPNWAKGVRLIFQKLTTLGSDAVQAMSDHN